MHPLLVSPLMIPRDHSHTGLSNRCFCARVPALGFGPLIPTPPAVHRNLPGRPSTRLRHPRRAHSPRPRLMRRIYRKFGAHEASVRASSPFLCPAHPVSSARGRLSGHQRTHIAKSMPLSLPVRFLDPICTLHHHTAPLTLFCSTLSPLNRFTASHRPRHPFCTGYRRSAAPTCLEAPILGAVDACAPSRAQNGAPRPVSTPLHRIRALRARCFCELQPPARASAQGAPLEGLGSNPGVARRYLTAPDR